MKKKVLQVIGTSAILGSLVWISQFIEGRPIGPCWKKVHHDTFLYCTGIVRP